MKRRSYIIFTASCNRIQTCCKTEMTCHLLTNHICDFIRDSVMQNLPLRWRQFVKSKGLNTSHWKSCLKSSAAPETSDFDVRLGTVFLIWPAGVKRGHSVAATRGVPRISVKGGGGTVVTLCHTQAQRASLLGGGGCGMLPWKIFDFFNAWNDKLDPFCNRNHWEQKFWQTLLNGFFFPIVM